MNDGRPRKAFARGATPRCNDHAYWADRLALARKQEGYGVICFDFVVKQLF
jgi:hypothetical protein